MENIFEERKKVCIIDDEQNIREIYSVKFELAGFDVISAVSYTHLTLPTNREV